MTDKYTARAQISSDFWTHIYIQRIFYFRDSKASKTKIIQLELFCIPLTPFSMLLLQNIPSILLSKPEILSHLWYLPFLNSPFCLLSSTLQRALSTMYQLIVTITQSVRLISLWTWIRKFKCQKASWPAQYHCLSVDYGAGTWTNILLKIQFFQTVIGEDFFRRKEVWAFLNVKRKKAKLLV